MVLRRVKLSSPQVKLVQLYAIPLGNQLLQTALGELRAVRASFFMFIVWNAASSILLCHFCFLDGLLKIIYVKPCLVSELSYTSLQKNEDKTIGVARNLPHVSNNSRKNVPVLTQG